MKIICFLLVCILVSTASFGADVVRKDTEKKVIPYQALDKAHQNPFYRSLPESENTTVPATTAVAIGPRILIYGVDKVSECSDQSSALQTELATLSYPNDWRILVACSPVAWQNLLRAADVHGTHSAFTNLRKRTTVINADIFRRFSSQYRRTLAHELGHILCNCSSEAKAEDFAFNTAKVR
jgi:hypothetical protein